MTDEEYRRRSREDFDFMVLCDAKDNRAMYQLLRDRELDAERDRRRAAASATGPALLTEDPDHGEEL